MKNSSDMGRSEHSPPSVYPLWSDRCWISMAVEADDGMGPCTGRRLDGETHCPDGNPQRLCHPLGFRERNVGELELRVLLGPGDLGVCQVIGEERHEEVYVRVLVCCEDADDAVAHRGGGYTDCPVRSRLDEPLRGRAVIDFDLDEELPLYRPLYLNNVRQPDHGYHYVARRRPGSRP